MTTDKCIGVTHQARNGAQALMGQLLILRVRLENLGILEEVDLSGIDISIQRILDAVDKCQPRYPVYPNTIE